MCPPEPPTEAYHLWISLLGLTQAAQYKRLEEALYPSYCACPEFGNRNYKTEGAILIDRPAEGLALALRQEYPVVLLCACRERLSCHRQTVAELLLAEGWEDLGELPWPARS